MSGLPVRGKEAKMERGTAPFPVRGGDRGRKSILPIRGGINLGEEKKGLDTLSKRSHHRGKGRKEG